MQFHRVLVFFLLGYYDDFERHSLRSKFQQIKQSSNDRLTKKDVLNKVLDFWICSILEQSHAGVLFIYLFIFIYLCIHLFIYLFVYLFIHLFMFLCLFIYFYLYYFRNLYVDALLVN